MLIYQLNLLRRILVLNLENFTRNVFFFPVDNWVARHELKNLGIPYYVGCGSHTSNGKRYRFLIMPRFGTNLHNVFCKTGQCFTPKTSFTLASYIVSIFPLSLIQFCSEFQLLSFSAETEHAEEPRSYFDMYIILFYLPKFLSLDVFKNTFTL